MPLEKQNSFIHDPLPQSVYDSYNEFIFSKDKKLFAKLASKLKFCELTLNIPGNIIELGVFKGSGIMAWLKANALLSNNHKHVYGFDIFDSEKLVSSIDTSDSKLMSDLFTKRNFNPNGYSDILIEIAKNSGFNNLSLIVGNVLETIPLFLEKNPGFRASIINFDLDTYTPTIFCLEKLWDRLVPGGIILFDEYAINEWTESDAVDEFLLKKNLNLISTPYYAPSAYLIKK
tara:strand:+ start:1881 stop:2573 length:693 start_codon:yes stop_codon:yes gene_type:complete